MKKRARRSRYYFVFRSSITGLYVSSSHAKRHPKTTERERRVRPGC